MRKYLISVLAGLALLAASGISSAHSGISVGISLGVPVVAAPVYYAPPPVAYYPPAPVYYAPPRVYYAPPVYYAPRVIYSRGGYDHRHRGHWR